MVQFSHMIAFKKLPGSVYLMMVIDICHASFSCKMNDTAIKLESLDLSAFPGENIGKFTNEAQRLIKVMNDGYALPYQLG